jgi:hypothetical protein
MGTTQTTPFLEPVDLMPQPAAPAPSPRITIRGNKLLAGVAVAGALLLAGGVGAAAIFDGAGSSTAPTSRPGSGYVSPQVARLRAEAELGLRVGAPVPPRLEARVERLARRIASP